MLTPQRACSEGSCVPMINKGREWQERQETRLRETRKKDEEKSEEEELPGRDKGNASTTNKKSKPGSMQLLLISLQRCEGKGRVVLGKRQSAASAVLFLGHKAHQLQKVTCSKCGHPAKCKRKREASLERKGCGAIPPGAAQ